MLRRAGRSAASSRPVMRSPRKSIVPDVGSSSARMMRASVDFPQPERPTSATDWPGRIEKETSSTARVGSPGLKSEMRRPG